MAINALGVMLRGEEPIARHPKKMIIRRNPTALRPLRPWSALCGPCTDVLAANMLLRAATHQEAVELAERHARVFHQVIL